MTNRSLVLAAGLAMAFVCLGSCRHATVRYPQPAPQVCEKTPDSKDCKRGLELQAEKAAVKGPVHTIKQNYYLFGLFPRNVVLDLSKYCSAGTKSVHQFYSVRDAVLEQLSLTIYSPQTIEVECYQ